MHFSVITPTYNRPEYLLEGLRSIQRQLGEIWEVVVVDDGDGSGIQVVRDLNDSRISAIQNPGTGQVEARNAGVRLANGDHIVLLDDDDLLAIPDYLSQMKTLLTTGPALVHSFGWMVEEEGGNRHLWDLKADPCSLRKDNTLLVAGLTYPRAFHKELGEFDATVGGYFDWDWHLRVTAAGYPLKTIESPSVVYRIHAGSGSSQVKAKRRRHSFELLRIKHGLETNIKNHAVVFSELRQKDS